MRTDLPVRPKLDERIRVALAPDEKRRVFEVAAEQRTSVSEFVRRAIVRAANNPTAA